MKDIELDTYGVTYDSLIDSMEVERLVELSDNSYQGDTRLLLKQEDRYGYLCFGWGSCSGCDQLEYIGDYNYDSNEGGYIVKPDHYKLRDELWNQIVWKDSATEMREYFEQKDWSLDYAYDKKFVESAITHLEGVIAGGAD